MQRLAKVFLAFIAITWLAGVAQSYAHGEKGFLKTGDIYSSIDYPGAKETFAQGINDAGQIVGAYYTAPIPNSVLLLGSGLLVPFCLRRLKKN